MRFIFVFVCLCFCVTKTFGCFLVGTSGSSWTDFSSMWKQDHSFHLPYNFQKGRCLLDSEATKPQSHITPLITQDFYIFRHLIMSYDWGLDFSKPVKVPLLTCSPIWNVTHFKSPSTPTNKMLQTFLFITILPLPSPILNPFSQAHQPTISPLNLVQAQLRIHAIFLFPIRYDTLKHEIR